MADITIVNGVYKPTYNWGAPSCIYIYTIYICCAASCAFYISSDLSGRLAVFSSSEHISAPAQIESVPPADTAVQRGPKKTCRLVEKSLPILLWLSGWWLSPTHLEKSWTSKKWQKMTSHISSYIMESHKIPIKFHGSKAPTSDLGKL